MAASTAPAAKQKLLDLLNARAALAASVANKSLKVRWAAPTEEADYKRDVIWLGETVEQEEEHIQLGGGANRRKHEEYVVEVGMQAYRTGDDPQGTETAWWELRTELAAAVTADPDLTGSLPSGYAQLESSVVSTQPVATGGWLSKGSCRVRCKAQI
jgi:hypothetical protein